MSSLLGFGESQSKKLKPSSIDRLLIVLEATRLFKPLDMPNKERFTLSSWYKDFAIPSIEL